ncbi:protein ANTAGONIST OF LIKE HETEROCHROMATIN PROTEIN 1 [Lingula anatina]|uniref:Protein ANTAGONIST OF LIKE HETEROCHROMATIN PROTEIN 1 n=1 Tax=Lingula anatina TaxID=7574 RepID=A0A1S3J5A0_LINAN|nr:protein ANTAGONIST OF LIKE HETEROCHROMATIN PROTEIN 1 [Lingula anatina]|eukprot:XP_013405607.1 protein ANTAGONIST OF LIKE HETEROCHROMATIN PROTEIN 1 [Lingula anatina]
MNRLSTDIMSPEIFTEMFTEIPSPSRWRRRMAEFLRMQSRQRAQFVLMLMFALFPTPDRTVWMKEKSSHWWEHIVNRTFTDGDWMENFCMKRATFQYLCHELRPFLEKNSHRKCYSVELRVAVTLWICGSGMEYRSIGHLFGIEISLACTIFQETVQAIATHLSPKFIQMPTGRRLQNIVEGFEAKWGVPQCAGAIDGTHVPIIAPSQNKTDYYNRKCFYSIASQVICDHELRVLHVVSGWPGRVQDAQVLAQSSIFQKAESGTLFPPSSRLINGVEVPILIIGDPAYPLKPWLLKAFSDFDVLTQAQKNFNYCHTRGRMCIEGCLSRCKGKWQILQHRLDFETEFVPVLILACLTLHNVVMVHNEGFDQEWMDLVEEDRNHNGYKPGHDMRQYDAKAIREAYVQYFNNR